MKITKSQAKEILGWNHETGLVTTTLAHKRLDISKQGFSYWDEELTKRQQNEVIGAIYRHNLRRRMNQVLRGE